MHLREDTLYRNHLKNRDFGKEAPQNFDPERATIAERQGASEDRNSEVEPTQSKTDSSSRFGIHKITAVVLAGGQGTRLFPLTEIRCKPAVIFGGRYRLIDVAISNALNSGIRRIAVISQFYGAHLNQHVFSTYHLDSFQHGEFQLLSPEETPTRKAWFLGTADAIRQNLDSLLLTPTDFFLILSGDQLYNTDLRAILDFAREKNAELVIASLPVPEAEALRMGLLKIDPSKQISAFIEKPSDPAILAQFALPSSKAEGKEAPKQYLGSMGIYVFKRSALLSLLQEEGNDFGHHLIPIQVKRGGSFSFVFDGYWEDIGTISSYYHANLALTERKKCLDIYNEHYPIYTQCYHLPSAFVMGTKVYKSLLAEGCFIEADEISQSIIGIRAKIGPGTIVRNSIVLGRCDLNSTLEKAKKTIGSHCHIERAIIDENAHVGDHVKLTNQQRLEHYDGDGIFIRDGIIIVSSGTLVPNGFVL